MKKIYLLVFFYLLKIDFCVMGADIEENNSIINELFTYKKVEIPKKIEKLDFDNKNFFIPTIEDLIEKMKKTHNSDNNIFSNNEEEKRIIRIMLV